MKTSQLQHLSTWVNYRNPGLAGLPQCWQLVQNAANTAHMPSGYSYCYHKRATLSVLHISCLLQWIDFKIAPLIFQALNGVRVSYTRDLIFEPQLGGVSALRHYPSFKFPIFAS